MTIEVQNGSFSYRNGAELLHDVHFEAEAGTLTAILGPNGVGKTTLLKCMLGLLKWKSGATLLDGQDIRKIPARSLWQQIAYVPQARNAGGSYTVEEMLLLGRASHIDPLKTPGEEDYMQVQQVMEKLHIRHLSGKTCDRISGGELQMVLIGRALVTGAQVLVLDEPESNLDFRNQLIVLETLQNLSAEGKVCIFNTHYPAHALQRSHKALLLSQDGTSLFGNTEDIITEENIERAFGVTSVIREIEAGEMRTRDVIPLRILE